jgi:hypothetical protein
MLLQTATCSDPCWTWPQSCRSPPPLRSANRLRIPELQTVFPPGRAALNNLDHSNSRLFEYTIASPSAQEGRRILFAPHCESLRFTENGNREGQCEDSHAGFGAQDSASAGLRQCERNGGGRGRRALECRPSRNEVGRTFYLSRFREIRIGSRERGAPKVLLCFVIASTLLERRQLRLAAKAYCLVVASAKRSAVRCVFTSIGNSLMEMRSPLL